jgi:hypothetical protein
MLLHIFINRFRTMKRKLSASELECQAARDNPVQTSMMPASYGEAMAMLTRRGLHPGESRGLLPFLHGLDNQATDRFSEWLGHYAFRLFLRGAIQNSDGFLPAATTRYLTRAQSRNYAEALVALGLGEKISKSRYRLKGIDWSFGETLEWYVGRELEKRFGFSVATGIKLHVRGGGGDLDVVAAGEGKLVYLELKSSPPKNLAVNEIAAFCDRLNLLRPDVSLFVVDTALRLSDKVLPMLSEEFRHRGCAVSRPKRIAAQLWALTPHVYAVNGRRDLMTNIGKAIAAGLLALSPPLKQPPVGNPQIQDRRSKI